MLALPPMFIKIYLAKEALPAKVYTMWTHLIVRYPTGYRRIDCLVMTCLKATSRAVR